MHLHWVDAVDYATAQSCFVSEWEGHVGVVARGERGWTLWVDGRLTKGSYGSSRAAMEAAAAAIDRVIMGRVGTVHARQRGFAQRAGRTVARA